MRKMLEEVQARPTMGRVTQLGLCKAEEVDMGFLDRLSEGAEKVAKQAEKALEQGKTKVEELQLERQMDGLAKKIGYMEYDGFRGRAVDSAIRQSYLDEMVGLEEQIAQAKAPAEAGAASGAPGAPEHASTEPAFATEPTTHTASADASAEAAPGDSPEGR
jgi:hypothetical protein